MSYKKTKASLKSRMSSGDFVQQDFSAAQQGIMAGANIIAQGMKDKYKERREEEKRKAAAAAKKAAASRKAEQEAQKNLRIATSIATRFGVELQNTGAMAYIMNEVEIHGTDAIGVVQRDVDDKKFQLPTEEITEEYVTGARADQAPPMRLSPNPDGSPRTTLSLGEDIDDLEATEPSLADASRSAAESAFSPQQLYKGKVQTETTTSQGFEFNPNGRRPEDIDFTQIQSVADVDGQLRNIMVNDIEVADNAMSELKNMRSTFYARESAAWISEASEGMDEAFAAMQRFGAEGNDGDYQIAKGIYTGWLNKTKPYEGLLDPEGFIGKSAQELRDTRAVARSLGASSGDFGVINGLITSTELVEADAKAQAYITDSSSYNRTVSQIEAALQSGDYTASSPLITHLNNVARKQQKQEILASSPAAANGAIAVDGLYTDPETGEKRFAVIMRSPDGTSKLRDGTEVEYMPLTEEEAKAFFKLPVQTIAYTQELNTAATAIAEGLRTSENVIQIARSDERVRNAGGSLAQFVTRFARGGDSVLSVVQDMFKDAGPDYVLTEQELRRQLKSRGISEGVLTAALSDNVQSLADKTARFEAGILALVFRSGGMEGQSGNAMSNKDFERLSLMLDVDGGIEAFETTVRNYMKDKILSYDDKALLNDTTGPIAEFKGRFKWSPVEGVMSFEDLVSKRNESTLTTAYQSTMGFANTTSPAPTIPQGAIDALTADPSLRSIFDEKYGAGEAAKVLGD
jgi:hypothetical protein